MRLRPIYLCVLFLCFSAPLPTSSSPSSTLSLPPEAPAILEKIYSLDIQGAVKDAKGLEEQRPQDPLGYLLEAEALWWRIWCASAEFKYGMSDARRRPKLESDQHYLDLAAKALQLSEAQLKQSESPEMHFYAGMADAASARLYGLRGENRAAARAGVRCREHLLRAKALDPSLADADLGLGLYNYYVDTLSTIAKILRFFMGIPGGSRQDGIRLLEHAISQGVLTPSVARFYLALNLHRYDQKYERALTVITPLTERFPSNPLFQLARGDLLAKLGRKEKALLCYRAAGTASVHDPDCHARIEHLVQSSIVALSLPSPPGNP